MPLLEKRHTDRTKEPSAAKHSDLINRQEISGAIRGEKKSGPRDPTETETNL